jgi:2-isopropylmalate synthase
LKNMPSATADDRMRAELLERVKRMESQGYELEAATGTFELLVRETVQPDASPFDVYSYHISMGKHGVHPLHTMATVTLRTGNGTHTATAGGRGPFHALHRCLQTCLAKSVPGLKVARLEDYKVRLLTARNGAAGKVRVLVRWSDESGTWATVGVSENVVEASWTALLDAVRLGLLRRADQNPASDLHARADTM